MTMFTEAQRLTAMGFIVHPLTGPQSGGNSPGKRPIKTGWQKLNTPVPEAVMAGWWGENAKTNYNMGLVCGRASGVMVLDVDSELFIDELFDGVEIDTLRSARVKGRGHVYFKYDPTLPASKHHTLGLEILSDNNNAVLPPSTHVSGDVYHWADPGAPIQEIPEKLKTRLCELFEEEKRVKGLIKQCRPCFKKVWKDKVDVHGADGRQVMLALCVELMAKGATVRDIHFVAKIMYGADYDQERTSTELGNANGKPWKCDTISETLGHCEGFGDCEDCHVGKTQNKPNAGSDKVKPTKQPRKAKAPGPEFMDGKQFIPKVLGDSILRQYSIITFPDSLDVAIFKDGVFNIAKGAQSLQEIITDKLGDDFQKNRLHEVITYIQISTYTSREEMNTHTHLINVRNGMYDVKADKLLQHDPKYKSTIQLNVVHDANAECPGICKFLSEVTTNEGQAKVIQYAGYSCTPDIKFQKTLLIDGPQQNGKSTFLEMVCHMIGQENTSQQSLQSLNDDRFARERLNNKLVNFYGDLPAKKLHDNSVFKMLTSDQYIDGEKKYGQKFRYKNTIHQMYALNKVPELSDPDEMAFFRRLICVSFPTSFEGKADRDLSNKITTTNEISGFFNMAMTGLRILIEQDEFAYNKTVEDIQKEYLNKSDPVSAFLDECTEYSNEEIGKKGLYETFKEWCKQHNIQVTLKDIPFAKRMGKLGYVDYRKSTGAREYYWVNIGYVAAGVEFGEIRPSTDINSDGYKQQQKDQPSECPSKNHILSYANIKDIIYSGYVEENVHLTRTLGRIDPKTQAEAPEKSVRVKPTTRTDSDVCQRDRVKTVKGIIMSLRDESSNKVKHEDIKARAEREGITDTDTIISHMVKDGLICDTGDKLYMVV